MVEYQAKWDRWYDKRCVPVYDARNAYIHLAETIRTLRNKRSKQEADSTGRKPGEKPENLPDVLSEEVLSEEVLPEEVLPR